MRFMDKKIVYYWIPAWLFAVLFGEVFLSGIVAQDPTIFQYGLPISIYYLVLTFIFALIVVRVTNKIALTLFFIYGVLAEYFVFMNIKSVIDFPGILFFGFLYVFLFGVPIAIYKKICKKVNGGTAADVTP